MNFDNFSSKICEFLASHELTEVEKQRFFQDLQKIELRLSQREYQKFNPNENLLNIPDRWQTFLVEIEFYSQIGQMWAQIFSVFNIHNHDRILDLCPGHSPKVELGLFYLGYKGQVHLINKDAKALRDFETFLNLFQPQFSVHPLAKNLFEDEIPHFSLVVANHALDDLVLDYCASKANIDTKQLYENELQLKNFWSEIVQNESHVLDELAPKISILFAKIVSPDGKLILTQYPSYIERTLKLQAVVELNKKLMYRIHAELLKTGFKDAAIPKSSIFKDSTQHFSVEHCLFLQKGFE